MKTLVADNSCFLEEPSLAPAHVAIIMDGNRRWEKGRNLPFMAGHFEGAHVLMHIVKAAIKMGVKVLTVYVFSTENWSRSSQEVEFLMDLFETYLRSQKKYMQKEGVKLDAIGDLSSFPESMQKAFYKTKEDTKFGDKIELILALNYGGRDEILRATKKIVHDCKQGIIKEKDISETLISQYMDTAKWKDPDLLIRTSGELRISNFLLWQVSYTEVFVSDVLWPDFTEEHFCEAIASYKSRKRRFGN